MPPVRGRAMLEIRQGDAKEGVIQYVDFLNTKQARYRATGKTIGADAVHTKLFPFQRDLVLWACTKGRAAIFADTGLGKTFMQLEWARLLCQNALIIAPLTVARQTVHEAEKIDLVVEYHRQQPSTIRPLTITNYEMIEHFDPKQFDGVILDESSILKALDGKTRQKLTEMFASAPYRLCCTATPAPNDFTEIGNHSEFLGVMPRPEMLASFFVHDDEGWRMRGHAEGAFYRWLASWAMSVRKPSDLGYDDDGFVLPPLHMHSEWVAVEGGPQGQLFFTGLGGIRERIRARRDTVGARCRATAELVNHDSDQWILWCGLNDESALLASLVADSVEVVGSEHPEQKAAKLEAFQDGEYRVLITKPRIAGFGLNLQNCHKIAFVGLSDSWESYYQCIRRCWRFGQEHPVDVHVVLSDWETEVYDNVKAKNARASVMIKRLIEHVQGYELEELGKMAPTDWEYEIDDVQAPGYQLMLGDSAERLKEVNPDSVGLSVFSPPFLSLYTYSPTERDMGNSHSEQVFFQHFGYVMDGLLKATMPGRLACVHVSQIPAMLVRDGYIGMKDFRGKTIESFEAHGWIYTGEVCIDKDPQAQAIRTHSKGLAFKQLKKDASWIRPALADYILLFRKPGDNTREIVPDIDNETWIEWARPIWYGIRESDTLNVAEARGEKDDRHICPLQLGTIERCIRLWSNKGDVVCDPFAGIGSTGYVAITNDRDFIGLELKRCYFDVAARNLAAARQKASTNVLFV